MHGELKPGLRSPNCQMRHVMPSDRALSSAGLKEADQILAEAGRRPILILGGSHSAYSVAGAFLELPGAERLAKGQIVILQRREPRIFYPDRQAALDDLYDVAPGDICPRTQRVNRMGGLRGFGREMWRQVAQRPRTTPEPRVVSMDMQRLSTGELGAMIAEAALVVPSFGYRSAMLPVFDAGGERLTLNADLGGVAVGEQSRLLLADGTSLPNLFGIGLGTGYKLPPSMGGEPNFDGQANSLWLYHNDIGAIIYRAIHELARQPCSGRRRLTRIVVAARPHETVSLSRAGHHACQPNSGMASVDARISIRQRSRQLQRGPQVRPGAERIAGLDVLRGFAAAAVMLHHHGQYYDVLYPGRIPLSVDLGPGHFGVELFFIISGFVILMTIERKQTVREFAISRTARLMPAFLAALVMATVIRILSPVPVLDTPTRAAIRSPTSPWRRACSARRAMDMPYWTLTYELVFYVGMGLILALGMLRWTEWFGLLAVAVSCLFIATAGCAAALSQPRSCCWSTTATSS